MIVSGIYPQCYAQNMKLVKQLGLLPQYFSWFSSRVFFLQTEIIPVYGGSRAVLVVWDDGKRWNIVATAFIYLHFKRAGWA